MKNNKTFIPYNYDMLLKTKLNRVITNTTENGIIEYRVEPTLIKDICRDPEYFAFKLDDYGNPHAVFNAVARKYKKREAIKKANAEAAKKYTPEAYKYYHIETPEEMYVRVLEAFEKYNAITIADIKRKNAKVKEEIVPTGYAPINYDWYKQAKVYALKITTGKIGWDPVNDEDRIAVVGYKLECLENIVLDNGTVVTAIEQLCTCKTYSNFKLNNHNIHEVFEMIESEYKQGNLQKAQRLYIKAIKAVREYNEDIIADLNNSIEFRLNRDKYQELGAKHDASINNKLRWNKLGCATLEERIKGLPEKQRQDWLARAADYGLNTPETELLRKDVYTMRIASIATEADFIHTFNTYHPASVNDPIKTFVGKHKQIVTRSADENETIAAAMWLAKHGDEFMQKCRPLYDIVYTYEHIVTEDLYEDTECTIYVETASRWVTETEILFTGTAEECYARLEEYREHYPTALVLPSDKEITVREARRLGISEYNSHSDKGRLCVRDFNYDAEDILD